MRRESLHLSQGRRAWRLTWLLTTALSLAAPILAFVRAEGDSAPPKELSREEAVRYALQNNPTLMTIRQQQGYAKSAVTLARTYPFNPVYTGYFTGNGGPTSAGITNRVFLEQYVSLELELRGQGKLRREAACATATRIEWEIAQQEMIMTGAVIRAYNAVLYRQQKLQAVEETIKLNDQAVVHVRKLADAGKMKATDVVLARIELDNVRAQRGPARSQLTAARSELRRLLGTLDDSFTVTGILEMSLPSTDQAALTHLALDQRPDLRARRAALSETSAQLNLARANRFGNPSAGPFYEYDPTRVTYIGLRLAMPIPVLNTHRGEIMKAETDVAKVTYEVRHLEAQASQEVMAALARWRDASQWADGYTKDMLPELTKVKAGMAKKFADNDPNVDLSRLLSVERSYLKATENLLDARYEMMQAQADLAMAAAEPTLAMGPPPGVVTTSGLDR